MSMQNAVAIDKRQRCFASFGADCRQKSSGWMGNKRCFYCVIYALASAQ